MAPGRRKKLDKHSTKLIETDGISALQIPIDKLMETETQQ
jgi:hypothetical protein